MNAVNYLIAYMLEYVKNTGVDIEFLKQVNEFWDDTGAKFVTIFVTGFVNGYEQSLPIQVKTNGRYIESYTIHTDMPSFIQSQLHKCVRFANQKVDE